MRNHGNSGFVSSYITAPPHPFDAMAYRFSQELQCLAGLPKYRQSPYRSGTPQKRKWTPVSARQEKAIDA